MSPETGEIMLTLVKLFIFSDITSELIIQNDAEYHFLGILYFRSCWKFSFVAYEYGLRYANGRFWYPGFVSIWNFFMSYFLYDWEIEARPTPQQAAPNPWVFDEILNDDEPAVPVEGNFLNWWLQESYLEDAINHEALYLPDFLNPEMTFPIRTLKGLENVCLFHGFDLGESDDDEEIPSAHDGSFLALRVLGLKDWIMSYIDYGLGDYSSTKLFECGLDFIKGTTEEIYSYAYNFETRPPEEHYDYLTETWEYSYWFDHLLPDEVEVINEDEPDFLLEPVTHLEDFEYTTLPLYSTPHRVFTPDI
uniref:Orf305 n=1 Tax=Ancoracysta twista TaxID=2044563 RepID=A0A2H4R8G6_9EUKA|nr:orf305 [Ancoracysta twista]ATY40933.1 orf305 [Ancoracysta twista]